MSNRVQIGLGLLAWATSASQQFIDVLSQASLSISYPSILDMLEALSMRSIEDACKIAAGPHCYQYDNINILTSIFVEQVPGAQNKMNSGTFSIIYELPPTALAKDTALAPLMARLRTRLQPLTMLDLRPSRTSLEFYQLQTMVNVVKPLSKYALGFSKYADDPMLKHKPCRRLPDGYKTQYHPLRCSTIEEASISGNILHHKDIYIIQLKQDPNSLNDIAIPTINDQLTNACNRGIQEIWGRDLTPWTRRELFAIAFGMFHLLMNLIWGLLHVHYGAINIPGSLSYFFALLEKFRLGGEHPDFHTLLAALTQILDGLLLNVWRQECALDGFPDFKSFLALEPTLDQLLGYARHIIWKYATPNAKLPSPILKIQDTVPTAAINKSDTIHENVVRLTRDLLYVIEIVEATADGNFGRIEDILPDLACVFSGAGSNKYSTEILHWIYNVKNVWTPKFANIMHDTMLVNPSGLPGRAMGIDLNIEHLIGYLKVCIQLPSTS